MTDDWLDPVPHSSPAMVEARERAIAEATQRARQLLRDLREQKGLSQTRLAEMVCEERAMVAAHMGEPTYEKTFAATVSKIETGEIIPSFRMLAENFYVMGYRLKSDIAPFENHPNREYKNHPERRRRSEPDQ